MAVQIQQGQVVVSQLPSVASVAKAPAPSAQNCRPSQETYAFLQSIMTETARKAYDAHYHLAKNVARFEELSGADGEIARAQASERRRKIVAVICLIVLVVGLIGVGGATALMIETTKDWVIFGLGAAWAAYHTTGMIDVVRNEFSLVSRLKDEQAEIKKEISRNGVAPIQLNPRTGQPLLDPTGQQIPRDATFDQHLEVQKRTINSVFGKAMKALAEAIQARVQATPAGGEPLRRIMAVREHVNKLIHFVAPAAQAAAAA